MKLSTQILLAFTVVLILSVIDTGSNYLLSLKVEQNSEFLGKSQEIIRNSGRLHKSIIEMQNSFRGFLLTQDSNFLSSYKLGIKDVPARFSEQKELIKGNSFQESILDSIKILHNQWIDYADSLISSKKEMLAGTSNIRYSQLFETRFKNPYGNRLNEEIAEKFLAFDKKEYETRGIHSKNLLKSIKQTHTFSFIFFGLTIIIGIGSTIYIVSLISKRIQTMVKFAESISQGKFTTLQDSHKDELTSLVISLNIMSDKLSKNIRELEKRNTELDKFAYVVSHDLKAPLRGIHNAINWIEEDLEKELSPEMKKYLGIIPQRVKRMEDLINGLLDYARIREKTALEKVSVSEMLKEITDTIVPRNFEVEMKDLPVINTERLKLEQVFTNLISNSVKYTPHAKGKITISSKEYPDYYEFSIIDNGIGIDPEYHEKVFEIFQTLREKNEKESTGIGLAIIKKILDDQHCAIRINSVPGEGAEFIFTWPKTNL